MFRTGISDGKWTGIEGKTGKRELVSSADGKWDGKETGFQPVFPSTSGFVQTSNVRKECESAREILRKHFSLD
jgi:hypothetical protein